MEKKFFSTTFLFIFAAVFSLFLVACLKEQGSTPQSAQADTQNLTASSRGGNEPIPACFPGLTEDGKDCADPTYVTDYINIPPYGNIPACNNVKVTYAVLKCTDKDGNVSINVGGLALYHDSNVCPDLEKYLNGLSLSSQAIEYDKIEYIASILVERKEILKLPYVEPQVESNYVVQNCFQRCKTTKIVGGKKYTVYKKLVCGEGCCIRSRKVTLNEAGQIQSFGRPTFKATGSCYKPTNWEAPVCDGELIEGECKQGCNEVVRETTIPYDN